MQHGTLFVLGARGGGRQELGEAAGSRNLGRPATRGEVEFNFRLIAADLPAVPGTGGRVQELRLIVILLLEVI